MNDTYYVKTYRPLVWWSIIFTVGIIGAAILGAGYLDGDMVSKIIMIVVTLGIIGLFYLIYNGEYVYWINGGPDFDEAYDAGSERRRKYAWEYLKLFLVAGTVINVFMIGSMIFMLPYYVDTAMMLVCLVTAAFRSMKIRF